MPNPKNQSMLRELEILKIRLADAFLYTNNEISKQGI
jgi:hypothetical protein